MPPIYYGSAPFALKQGSQALNLYYGSTLISGGASIGGVNIGDAGTGIYTGYVLSDGDEFNSLSLVSSSTPAADYFTTRLYMGGSGAATGMRAPPTGPLAVMHDVSPDYTGWNDAGRGVAGNFDSHQIVGGALRLKSIRQSAGEQTLLNTGVGGQIERGSMIHTAGRLLWNSPAIIEWRAKVPQGPAGQHPTVWAISSQPPSGTQTGNEYGFEGSSLDQQAYHGTWTAGAASFSTLGLSSTYRDGNAHTFTIIVGASDYKYYVDGTLVNTIAVDPDTSGSNKADYCLITNHIYNSAFLGDNYSAAAWAAASSGVNMDIEWLRVWRPTAGSHYQPLTTIADTLSAYGGSGSIVLPSQSALWGATGLTETVYAIPNEAEEPGGSNSVSYGQFPTGVSYNSGTRTISFDNTLVGAGVLHFAVGVTGDGITCKPARFRLFIAPRWVGSSSFAWTVGTSVSYDVYAGFDVGRLFQSGANPKGLSVSGLPAGLSFSSSTGLITGTPSGTASGSLTISATNSAGQSVTSSPTFSVSAAASGVAAPTLTGSPSLLASYDFGDASKVTTTGGLIDSITGSDGTSVTLTNTGANRPTATTRSGKQVAQFTAASSTFLRATNTLGAPAAMSIVIIAEPTSSAATFSIFDHGVPASSLSLNRNVLVASATNGYSFRKCSSAAESAAQQGVAFDTTIRCLVAVSPSGTSAAELNVDGTATAIVSGTSVAVPSGPPNSLSLGCDNSGSANNRFANMYCYRVLVYAAALNATQREEIAVWATSNYGTTNNA